MIDTLLNVFTAIALIGAVGFQIAAFRNNRKVRELNRRTRAAIEESEAINRRSRELLADAARGQNDDCDQEDAAWGLDEAPTSTRQRDPWAEIHHPDKHQPAPVQIPGLAANLYLCQCGKVHQRYEPPVPPSEPTRAEHLAELDSMGWKWNEVPTSYVGVVADDPAHSRMTCWHCESNVTTSETSSVPSCTNVECPGKLDFLHEMRAMGNVVRGSN